MKDFLQRWSLRDSMFNYGKIEIFDSWIRKLSGNEMFWWFYFGSNFLIGWAGRRGHALAPEFGMTGQNLAQNLFMILDFCFVTLKASPDLLTCFCLKSFTYYLFLTEVYRTPRSNENNLGSFGGFILARIFLCWDGRSGHALAPEESMKGQDLEFCKNRCESDTLHARTRVLIC